MKRTRHNGMFYNLLTIQFKEFWRSPGVIFWALIFPPAMAAVLGGAFTGEDQSVHGVALVTSRTATLPAPVRERLNPVSDLNGRNRSFTQSDVNVALAEMTEEAAALALKRGRVVLILAVEKTDRGVEFIHRFDPRAPEARLVHLALRERLRAGPTPETSERKAGGEITHKVERLTAPGSRYIDFLVPGLIGLGIMNAGMWGIGWNLIELRMKKLLRRLAASPMPRWQFLLSVFTARLALGTVETTLLVGFAIFAFDVELQGGVAALVLVCLSGTIAFGGLAILTASRTDNSRIGNGIINAMTLPMLIFSGVFFSYRNFPEWMHAPIQLLPLTGLADALRAVFTEGADLMASLPSAGLLCLWGVVFFLVGLRLFRWH